MRRCRGDGTRLTADKYPLSRSDVDTMVESACIESSTGSGALLPCLSAPMRASVCVAARAPTRGLMPAVTTIIGVKLVPHVASDATHGGETQ